MNIKRNKPYKLSNFINFPLILCALLLLCGCKKDKMVTVEKITMDTPTVTTTASTATIDGTYNYKGTLIVVRVVYSKNSDYSSSQSVAAKMDDDSYTVTLKNLDAGTKYYFYCVFDTGYGADKSEQNSFTTQSGGGGTHDYVDLGLPSGLLWATCNVGAENPEDYGDYFAWGETTTKSDYGWDTYKWCNGSLSTLTKYCTNSSYGYNGFVDNKTVLEMTDDAARANWGGDWRMPTKTELEELKNNCTWTWTTQNGRNGRIVTGPNGNSIFLPAAGYDGGSSLYDAGSGGYYWSSSLNTDIPDNAYLLYFGSSNVSMSRNYRRFGRSVRPVCPLQVTTVPTVTTSDVSNITETTATCGGNVTSDGGATVTARGVCWSTSENPTISDSHTTNGSGTGSFTSSITGLSENTTYYVRAYATNSAGTSYGAQNSFATQSGGGGGSHEYVDLGLSVLWATCNVGAENPEDYGDYFAWGETEPKSDYSLSTYQWCNGSPTTLTKYCTDSDCGYNGFVDNKTVLEMSDDAARANWGDDWRMPTESEMEELKNNCIWTWNTQNGKNGRRVTDPNGKSIFLPAAGCYDGSSLNYAAGSYGYYWSSSLYTGYPDGAYNLGFDSSRVTWFDYHRYYGLSVRPVCPPQN